MTDSSHFYFNYPSEPTDSFGRPNAWLWGDDAIDGPDPTHLSFSPEDYMSALGHVYDAVSRVVSLRKSAGCLGYTGIPDPEQFHDMVLDVADAFATERRRTSDD